MTLGQSLHLCSTSGQWLFTPCNRVVPPRQSPGDRWSVQHGRPHILTQSRPSLDILCIDLHAIGAQCHQQFHFEHTHGTESRVWPISSFQSQTHNLFLQKVFEVPSASHFTRLGRPLALFFTSESKEGLQSERRTC